MKASSHLKYSWVLKAINLHSVNEAYLLSIRREREAGVGGARNPEKGSLITSKKGARWQAIW